VFLALSFDFGFWGLVIFLLSCPMGYLSLNLWSFYSSYFVDFCVLLWIVKLISLVFSVFAFWVFVYL
jgi:hypothetical protein